jgi:hypothetical protein
MRKSKKKTPPGFRSYAETITDAANIAASRTLPGFVYRALKPGQSVPLASVVGRLAALGTLARHGLSIPAGSLYTIASHLQRALLVTTTTMPNRAGGSVLYVRSAVHIQDFPAWLRQYLLEAYAEALRHWTGLYGNKRAAHYWAYAFWEDSVWTREALPTPEQVLRIIEHHLDPATPNPFRVPKETRTPLPHTSPPTRIVWET